MHADSKSQAELETTESPTTEHAQRQLQEEMSFSYRQAIAELIFAMAIARMDMSPAVIKLSKCWKTPAKCHYEAVNQIFLCLRATRTDGVIHWQPQPNKTLSPDEIPKTHSTPQALRPCITIDDPQELIEGSDSTLADDQQHRQCTGGTALFLAGGVIYYRTRIHPTVAQSFTTWIHNVVQTISRTTFPRDVTFFIFDSLD
jgi:hypothetical protein